MNLQENRKLLFTPCTTRAHFKSWIIHFLKIDFPDCIVVEDESNSSPLDAAWEYYDRILRNDLAGSSKVMTYANRGGFKTLSAAVLETMALLHTTRNIGHMAAIEAQSKKSASYIKDFFRRPVLKDFVVGDNSREIKLVRFAHKKTGEILNDTEFSALTLAQQQEYHRRDNYLKIVVCTMAGANSDHVEFFVIDEVDVVPKQNIAAYHQAQNIPDPRDGMLPLTLLTSTRKSRTGLVQHEIDESDRTKLKIKHWNLIDVTHACEPARHKPDEPKQEYYINDDQVRHITKDQFDGLSPGEQKGWYTKEGFAGCKNCRIFAACKGRLATNQTSKSPMLKPISFAIEKFQQAPSPDFITTEYLCRKPDASGLVFPRLSEDLHKKTANQMAAMVLAEDEVKNQTKTSLIQLLMSKGARFYTGMDFGFTHPFAIVTIATFGQYVFVLDCYSQPGLELDDQTANSEYIKLMFNNPRVYADPAYPGSIKTFSKRGFRMIDWEKKPFSVKAGIEIIRSLLMSGRGKTRLFFLAEDSGVSDKLWKNLKKYKLVVTNDGLPTEEPDGTDDDEADALRYVVMNVLGSKGALKEDTRTALTVEAHATPESKHPNSQQNWMTDLIRRETGSMSGSSSGTTVSGTTVKKNRFVWDG